MRVATMLVLAFATAASAQQQVAFQQEPKPKVKIGEIKAGNPYTSSKGMFSITVPPRNWAVDTYKFSESQLKYENYDYEEVIFYIADFGQAYRAGLRRIPPVALEQMAKEEEKQTLSNLANRALVQWRNYAEEPQPVEESSIQTQFGAGLLRIYLAKHSSLVTKLVGEGRISDRKREKIDAYIAVLVVKKGEWFIYATAEDDALLDHSPGQPPGQAPPDPKPILSKNLQSFFASMTVTDTTSKASLPAPAQSMNLQSAGEFPNLPSANRTTQ